MATNLVNVIEACGNRDRAETRELYRNLGGAPQRIFRNFGHKAVLQRFVGGELAPGQAELDGAAFAHRMLDRTKDQHRPKPDAHLSQPEEGVLPRDRDVRVCHEPRSSRQRGAVDRRDEGVRIR